MPGLGKPVFPPAWAQHLAFRQVLERRQIVSCGGGHGDAVALTFDDGPSPYTTELLRILRRGRAHATFFDVGNRLAYWPRAAYAEARSGGVGDHTWSHAHLTRLPHWLVWLELMRTQYEVASQVGWKPRLFRTPYAEHSRATDDISVRLGLVEVFWNVDARTTCRTPGCARSSGTSSTAYGPARSSSCTTCTPGPSGRCRRSCRRSRRRGLRAVSVQELLALDPPAPRQRCHTIRPREAHPRGDRACLDRRRGGGRASRAASRREVADAEHLLLLRADQADGERQPPAATSRRPSIRAPSRTAARRAPASTGTGSSSRTAARRSRSARAASSTTSAATHRRSSSSPTATPGARTASRARRA